MDKEMRGAVAEIVTALNRNADATEAMLDIARAEQIVMAEPGPSVCPHCGKLDPVVTQLGAEGGSGELSEFVMRAETHCCNQIVYAIPLGWDTTTSADMAADILKIKKGGRPE